MDLGSSSGSGVDFRAGLPAGHRIGWGVDEGVSRVVISFVINLRSMLSGYWGLGVKYRGHFRVGVGSSRDYSRRHSRQSHTDITYR